MFAKIFVTDEAIEKTKQKFSCTDEAIKFVKFCAIKRHFCLYKHIFLAMKRHNRFRSLFFEAMQRYKRYSRGYKNRAIVQKMFEILPIFDDGLQSQLFKSMAFFVSRTHLTCMLDTYPGRSGQVGRHRRP